MKFAATQNFAAFLMALAGLGASALGGGDSAAAWMAIAAGLGASLVPVKWMDNRVWQVVWSTSTLAGLAVAILAVAATGSLLVPIHVFVIYLVVVKLYNRRKADDYFHLYLTSLMALVGAAATNFGPSFVVCLVVHLLASFWTLSMYRLRKDLETAQLIRHKSPGRSRPLTIERVLSSKRVVTLRFLLGFSAAALGALAFAGLFFLLFPRIGVAGFNSQGQMQGFARQVDLGGIGLVRDDPRLVMRVRVHPRPASAILSSIHWRAATLDRYERGRWKRSRLPVTKDATGRVLWSCDPDRRALHTLEREGRILHQRILALPDTDGLLPSAFPSLSLRIIRPNGSWNLGLSQDASGAVQNPWPDRPVLYESLSVLGTGEVSAAAPTSALPCTPTPDLNPKLRRAYLSLPRDVGTNFLALAQKISDPRSSATKRIRAAIDYLSPKNGFSYTRRLPLVPAGQDPVLYFLLKAKRGHCEYFASSLTLLLRAMGLPARLAVGYLGGRWNPYGEFLAVRRGDAHAWTEVWLDGRGWILLDATPPEGRHPTAHPGLWARLSLWLDALRVAYLRWIVDYDTMTQFHLIRRTSRSLPWRKLALGLLLAAGILVILLTGRKAIDHITKRRSKTTRDAGRRIEAADRSLKLLLSAATPWIGIKPPGRPLRSHMLCLADQNARALAIRAVDAYYELRFAGSVGDAQALLKQLTDAARQAAAILSANTPR